jgi:hypothetical protein
MTAHALVLYLWIALGLLVAGSFYLIVEGVRVYRLFSESIVGRLVKTLVIVFLIELYSLGIISIAFITFRPQAVVVIFPIVVLWIITLLFAILAIRSAKMEVARLMK